MKEIGGYFELELDSKKAYHHSAISLNSGRNALKYILKSQKIKKIYIPNYICNSIIEPIIELSISYEFYNIDYKFEIIKQINLFNDERILYVNYFGLKYKYVTELVNKYQNYLIVDNTQDFFQTPIKNIDTIYSPRKFFGTSDGGYLYTNNLLKELLTIDESHTNSLHLLSRIDKDASSFYNEFKEAEKALKNQPIKIMSNLTNKILLSINYNRIKKKRKENFKYLHNELKDFNLLVDINIQTTPFVYPFISNDIKLRDKLIKNKIYIAKYWQEVLERDSVSNTEVDLVNKLLPLPIDQRYDFDDMSRISKIIRDNI
ncbi:MAG: hypothetical protein CMD09_04865 [Flavobacteriales bacterium]|nr:hypothetical protein [Flavobacteriales bacterium]|tara:strand:+ start:4858 stop:5808 length:951 start_codon:yes stop_codon:yes gene_type:complete